MTAHHMHNGRPDVYMPELNVILPNTSREYSEGQKKAEQDVVDQINARMAAAAALRNGVTHTATSGACEVNMVQ